jgi:hypothetical protein
MSLIDTAPAGAEGNAAPAAQPEITDQRSAAAAFEGLLDWEETGVAGASDTASAADDAADTGAEETQPTGDDEDELEPQDGDDAGQAAIEPPASWSAEDKAVFSKLPPEAQATIARRESERDRLVQTRTQEIADQRKAYDAQRQAIEGQSRQYLESLHTMLQLAVPEAEQFAAITDMQWQQLSVSDPARYVQLRAAREALAERVGKVQTEMQRVGQENARAQQTRQSEFLAEQKTKLVAKIPEFSDPAKAAALGRELNDALTGIYGFTPEEIGQALDHRLIVIARDAMLYRKAEAARKAADAKRNNPPPRVQQPNAAPDRGDGQARSLREKRANLVRTGSVRDAAALFMDIIP